MVGSTYPGGEEASKGMAVRHLKSYASWVQTVLLPNTINILSRLVTGQSESIELLKFSFIERYKKGEPTITRRSLVEMQEYETD